MPNFPEDSSSSALKQINSGEMEIVSSTDRVQWFRRGLKVKRPPARVPVNSSENNRIDNSSLQDSRRRRKRKSNSNSNARRANENETSDNEQEASNSKQSFGNEEEQAAYFESDEDDNYYDESEEEAFESDNDTRDIQLGKERYHIC